MFKKNVILNENQKGFVFEDGKFVKMLSAGKHKVSKKSDVKTVEINNPVPDFAPMEVLMKDDDFKSSVVVVEVPDGNIAFHFIDGNFKECLRAGKYIMWAINEKHTFQITDISEPEVSDDIPKYFFDKIPSDLYKKFEVSGFYKAHLYYNNKLVKLLDAGTYYFWKNGSVDVSTVFVDTRLIPMNVTNQEVLTKDKVTIRVSLVCTYRIKDYIKVITDIGNYSEQIHIACQLAMREYIGKYRLDEILESKEQMSEYILSKMQEKAEQFFVDIYETSVKDIILPGEIREIMNTVLIAEKKAQANVITRREEIASTRSLLNTAKLLDENKTLYKLKELEYIERICNNVSNINLNGSGDILSQITKIVHNS